MPKPADSADKEDELAGTEQPFVQHLIELRDRILWAFGGLCLAAIALMIWPGPAALIDFIAMPIRAHMPPEAKLIAVGVLSPFLVPLKVVLMAALLVAMPWVIYQAWAFIAPGLYSHEKRFALPLILIGSLLAYVGIGFVQFFVLDNLFAFIQRMAPESVAATPDVASYVSVILTLYIGFALAFQVPVVVMLLVQARIVPVEKLREFRPYFIIVAFVFCAIVTPPDPISMLALAIPMCLLYELGLWAAGWFQPKPEKDSEGEAGQEKGPQEGKTAD